MDDAHDCAEEAREEASQIAVKIFECLKGDHNAVSLSMALSLVLGRVIGGCPDPEIKKKLLSNAVLQVMHSAMIGEAPGEGMSIQ